VGDELVVRLGVRGDSPGLAEEEYLSPEVLLAETLDVGLELVAGSPVVSPVALDLGDSSPLLSFEGLPGDLPGQDLLTDVEPAGVESRDDVDEGLIALYVLRTDLSVMINPLGT
jgi:hypothetical protein